MNFQQFNDANNRGYYILGYSYKECCNDISDNFSRDGTYDLNCFLYNCRLKINPRQDSLAAAKIDSQRQSLCCFIRTQSDVIALSFLESVTDFKRAIEFMLLFLNFRILHIVCYSPQKRHFRFWPYRLCRVGAIHTKKKFVLLCPRTRRE